MKPRSPDPVVRHSPADVLSWRHAPSWLLLAGAAGAGERRRLHLGRALREPRHRRRHPAGHGGLLLERGVGVRLLLVAFVLGATASVLALQARSLKGERPAHAAPLVVVAALVAGVGLAAHAGFATSEARELWLLGVLGLAMGLMNASVARARRWRCAPRT